MLAWLFRKGVAGSISSDLIKKYLTVKSRHPEENEEQILTQVWNLWLILNEKHILLEKDLDKAVRLDIIKKEWMAEVKLMHYSGNVKAYSDSTKTFFTLRPRYSLKMGRFGTTP